MTEPRDVYTPSPRVIRVLSTRLHAASGKSLPADLYTGQIVELTGLGLYRVEIEPMTGVADVVRMNRAECGALGVANIVDCEICRRGTPVGHLGSYLCRSGGLRAGGVRSHCTCDTCF